MFDNKIFKFLLVTNFATIIYLPALLYRWNLKASAWLGAQVALLLSPVLWANDETMRHKTAYWTTRAVQSVLWSVWVGLSAGCWRHICLTMCARWLISALGDGGLWPFSAADFGPALWFAGAAGAVSAWLAEAAYPVRAAHGKALEGLGIFTKAIPKN